MNIKELQESLGTSTPVIRNECGDSNLFGKKGKVFVDSPKYPFWYIFISETRQWNQIKKRLSFMIVSQDGDNEGILKLDRFPTKTEASVIRKIVGLRKKKELSPKHLQILMESGKKSLEKLHSTKGF